MVRTKATAKKISKDVARANTNAIKKSSKRSAAPAKDGKKKRRFRPGTVALRQIRKFQTSCDTLIPRAPFKRLVREIAHELNPEIRFQSKAIDALAQAAEPFLVEHLEASQRAAIHDGRVTITAKDSQFVIQNNQAFDVPSYKNQNPGATDCRGWPKRQVVKMDKKTVASVQKYAKNSKKSAVEATIPLSEEQVVVNEQDDEEEVQF